MTDVKFDGDLNDVSENQLLFISEVLHKNGFDGAKVSIKVLGAAGDNYMSSVKRIVAEKDSKYLQIVAKIASTVPKLREVQNVRTAFHNEHIMYNELLPKLRELEMSAGIPETKRYKYPTCHGVLLEDMNEMVLLEDLSELNFTIFDRFKSLNNDSVKLVLQNFARLHAFSYGLKAKEPEIFESFKSRLFDMWDNTDMTEAMAPILEATEKDVIALLDEEKYKATVEGSLSKLNQHYKKQFKYDKDSRFSVILHGDAWTNNIMFRSQEGKPVDCCMIDYQLSRIGSPVTDLTYFIFNCTDYEARKAHFYDWIEFYHSELGKNLFLFGLESIDVYPKDRLDADLKRHYKVALAMSILLSTVLIRENTDAEKLKSVMNEADMDIMDTDVLKVTALKESTIALFKTKVQGVVDSFYDLGFIVA